MACLSANIDITGWTYSTANCRFVLKDPANNTFASLDMGTMTAEDTANGGLLLSTSDPKKADLRFTAAQLVQIGGITADAINTLAGQCRFGGAGGGGGGGGDAVPREFDGELIFDVDANAYKWAETTIDETTGTKTVVYYDRPNGAVVPAPAGEISAGRDDTTGTDAPAQFNVAAANASTQLIPANVQRVRVTIVNNNTANLHISLGDAADVNDISLATGEVWIEEFFKGAIFGFWEAGFTVGQGARIVELT